MKVLIIQQKMIGDVLLSTILCKNLKLWNPEITVDFVANRHTLDVIKGNPYIDNIIVFEESFKKNKLEFFRFLIGFKKKKYDFLIDAYGKSESNLITLFTPAKKKIAYYKYYTQFFYTHPLIIVKETQGLQLSIIHRFSLLEPIMGDFKKVTDYDIFLSEVEIETTRKRIEGEIGKGKKIIMISAMGSSWEKTYPFEYMAKLIDIAHEKTQANIILNFMPDQKIHIDELIEMVSEKTKTAISLSLTPKSLRDYIATCFHCFAVIGNEGGAINIAKGLSKPTFAVFSPLVNPIGWHTEIPLINMAVHLNDFFPNEVDHKNRKKLRKDPKHLLDLHLKLKPSLFETELSNFLKNAVQS